MLDKLNKILPENCISHSFSHQHTARMYVVDAKQKRRMWPVKTSCVWRASSIIPPSCSSLNSISAQWIILSIFNNFWLLLTFFGYFWYFLKLFVFFYQFRYWMPIPPFPQPLADGERTNMACQNILCLESVVHYSAKLQLAQQHRRT